MLSGYEIDVYRNIESHDDVELTEFVDEIEAGLRELTIGCDTARDGKIRCC